MTTFHEALLEISGENLYISIPEVMDFTSIQKPTKIVIHSLKKTIEIPFTENDLKFKEIIGFLSFSINSAKSILVTWNLKVLLSYVKGRLGTDLELDGKIFDLKFLESYCGENKSSPTSFGEAFQRLSNLGKKNNWKDINTIYQKVYLPLIFTMPMIETIGVAHKAKHSKLYPFYEIDGQINGRMKCSSVFSKSFNPHGLVDDDKENIRPLGFEQKFMCFDFKHMEVSVLQWLSKDEYLGELLITGQDLYSAIWESLTKQACNPVYRQKCKDIFLPVVYGLGAEGLSKKLDWPLDVTKNVIYKLQKIMPQAFDWIKKQQDSLIEGVGVDFYGRTRSFDASYKVRNFVIQSPASLVCLHKLVEINKALKVTEIKMREKEDRPQIANLVMHIHDGYVLTMKNSNIQRTYEMVKPILEAEDELYPGLRLKTTCGVGEKLNSTKEYGVI